MPQCSTRVASHCGIHPSTQSLPAQPPGLAQAVAGDQLCGFWLGRCWGQLQLPIALVAPLDMAMLCTASVAPAVLEQRCASSGGGDHHHGGLAWQQRLAAQHLQQPRHLVLQHAIRPRRAQQHRLCRATGGLDGEGSRLNLDRAASDFAKGGRCRPGWGQEGLAPRHS